jgi:hypothetical protein
MRGLVRKSAPGVKGGKVQKKNRQELSPDIYEHDFEHIVFQRMRPLKGYYHAVTVTDVKRFIAIVPDWEEVAANVRAIVLTPGHPWRAGSYNEVGVIKLDAWPKFAPIWVGETDRWLLEQMGLEVKSEGLTEVGLNRSKVRCYQLLGTLLHELGHHADRMGTRRKRSCANGEPFAVAYEHRRQRELWDAYVREFGAP